MAAPAAIFVVAGYLIFTAGMIGYSFTENNKRRHLPISSEWIAFAGLVIMAIAASAFPSAN